MHLLQEIEINNFLNLKHARLESLKDLNVIIGPNNCGKTSVLRGINLLQRISFGRWGESFDCAICKSVYDSTDSLLSLSAKIDERERFLNRHNPQITFTFDVEEIERTLPHLIKERDKILDSVFSLPDETRFRDEITHIRNQVDQFRETVRTSKNVDRTARVSRMADELERNAKVKEDAFTLELEQKTHLRNEFADPKILLKQIPTKGIITEHISFMINQKFSEDVLKTMIFCPDARLDVYKGASIPTYISDKNLPTTEQTVMIQFLKDLVDLKLTDMRQNMDLIRIVEDTRFDTTIAEQGSGVKSLICLIADILAGTKTKILLIDEPELGLNPSGKQAFLRFLLGQCREKQVFIATHDPTFVNPLLWRMQDVSVYVYSVAESQFVRVNLEESKTDPNTFAGYLPHTSSLKQIHIYVEGSRDVYIYQIFLEKYAKENFENWYEIINRIGIYHLAGDFWSHLLYTIPKNPYFSIVILDGDKRERANNVIRKYDAIEKNRFQFFSSIDDVRNYERLLRRRKTLEIDTWFPVVCLKRSEIEDYLEPKPAAKELGPSIAQQMGYVPEEIAQIFSVTFRLVNIRASREDKSQQTMS
jgi:AAA15 family ATPase/GTPase